LLDALPALGVERCVVQCGHGYPPAGAARAMAFMPFQELKRALESCEHVVTHAGVGSILAARRAGHVPVVVPRLKRLNEHVDDHQVELTRALAASAKVVPVWDVAKLAEAIALAPPRRVDAAPVGAPRFTEALRAAILAA
jgi:UDP-N-acetylglucosamine transferase subunit ALG13